MYPDSSEGLNKETDQAVYFFTTAFHPLDNYSAHQVKLWGKTFPTAEHAFQWKKYAATQPELAEKILAAPSPEAVRKISESNKDKIPQSWHQKRLTAMEEIIRAKTQQHEDVRDILKKTGQREIIENSPVDDFWGGGPDGNGQNMIGKIWMKIRDEIA